MDNTPRTKSGVRTRPLGALTDSMRSAVSKVPAFSKAQSPASYVGRSGVRHTFTLGASDQDGSPEFVCDVKLSDVPLDETDVLAFFIKVYDVGAKASTLCASPGFGAEAKKLAAVYRISLVEGSSEEDLGVELATLLSLGSP